jgi:hypothetical protein
MESLSISACEIRLRAERKAGELDNQREKAKPGPRPKLGSTVEPNSPPTLDDLGISKRQAHDWRKLAGVKAANPFPRGEGVRARRPCPQGRKAPTTCSAAEHVSKARLSLARSVMRFSPDLARRVLAGDVAKPWGAFKCPQFGHFRVVQTLDSLGPAN